MKSRGSILVIVMITLIFTAAALVAFLDKASNDLLVQARVVTSNRMRVDAYSALEVTLAVVEDFFQADQGLRSPNEGWGTPLDWAGWTPSAGHTVDVAFQDESGKIPLIRVGPAEMLSLFEFWQMTQDDAQHLTDVLQTWMHQNYIASVAPSPDYAQSALPYDPPLRALRSYGELAAIDFVKDSFFGPDGRPNDLWWRFYNDFSIYNFPRPNINGANEDVLAGVGQFTPDQVQSVANFMAGKGDFSAANPLGVQWFQSAAQIRTVAGPSGKPGSFNTTIAALRILITVHEGANEFRLSAVVSPQGGATTVQTTASDTKKGTANGTTGESGPASALPGQSGPSKSTATPTSAQTAAAASSNLRFPFTILEIRENNDILTPPPPPPPPSP